MAKKKAVWFRSTAALTYLREEGHALSDPGLRKMGEVHGFAKRDDKGRWWFSRNGIDKYLKRVRTAPPEGWVPIAIAAKDAGVSGVAIRNWINKGLLKTKPAGSRQGAHVESKAVVAVRDRNN